MYVGTHIAQRQRSSLQITIIQLFHSYSLHTVAVDWSSSYIYVYIAAIIKL